MSGEGGLRLLATVVWLLSCIFLTSGCGEPEETTRADRDTTTSDKTVAVGDGQSTPEAAAQADPFPSPPTADGGTEGAADHIRAVEFEVYDGYERAVIKFGRGGKGPTGVPVWTLTSPGEGGYVRLAFPGLSSTATAGGDFVGLVMDEFYVVRDPAGGLFVDIFAIRSFRYRVSELSVPGRLAVDYRTAAGGLNYPVVRGEKAVVLQPREAEQVTSPLWVRGYTRHFGGSTSITLKDRDGEVLASKTVPAPDRAEAWGYFETKLDFTAKDGLATLLVGQRNQRDATFEDVDVPISLEGG